MGAMIPFGFVREISDGSFLLPFSKTFLLLYPDKHPGEEKQLMSACCGPWAYFFSHIVLLHPQGNHSRWGVRWQKAPETVTDEETTLSVGDGLPVRSRPKTCVCVCLYVHEDVYSCPVCGGTHVCACL